MSQSLDFVEFTTLPDDMQQLLIDWFDFYAGTPAPNILPLVSLPINQFPPVSLDPDRTIPINVQYLPPIVVSGDIWMDGRHRVAAARQRGDAVITSIDLGSFSIKPFSADYIGILKRDY